MHETEKESRFHKAELILNKYTKYAIKFSILILFSVVSWRIAWSKFNLDLSKFDFSDLLALILALFAMFMSIAFYFKSTDSSNQFYDNIYNFTQKTSEILGRIEERFGERLRHIDEGYGRIESRFDGITRSSAEIQEKVIETEGKEVEEKGKLEEANREMHKLMEELTKRAKMQEAEKHEFYENIERLTQEKNSAQIRLHQIEAERDMMQQQLELLQRENEPIRSRIRNSGVNFLLNNPRLGKLISSGAPTTVINQSLQDILSRTPIDIVEDLKCQGIITANNQFTRDGISHFSQILNKYN